MEKSMMDWLAKVGMLKYVVAFGSFFAALFALFEIMGEKATVADCKIHPEVSNRLAEFLLDKDYGIGEPTPENLKIAGIILEELENNLSLKFLTDRSEVHKTAARALKIAVEEYLMNGE